MSFEISKVRNKISIYRRRKGTTFQKKFCDDRQLKARKPLPFPMPSTISAS